MPKLQQTVVVSTEQQIVLAPKIRQKLLTELRAYQKEKAKLDAAQAEMDKIKAKVQAIREDTGEESISLEGFTSTLVAPIREVFDEKLFVRLGGDLDVYNGAKVPTPSKSYEKITVPK